MGFILDIIIVAIVVLCVIRGFKKGFIKSVMNAVSVFLAALISWFLSPLLSGAFYNNVFHPALSSMVEKLITSLMGSGAGVDNLSGLFRDRPSAFTDIFNKFGVDITEIEVRFQQMMTERRDGIIENISSDISSKAAWIVSNVLSFVAVFLAALIVLKLITLLLNAVFSTKLLSPLNKGAGVIMGIVIGLIWSWVLVFVIKNTEPFLCNMYPNVFSKSLTETSFIIRLVASMVPNIIP